jgi:hypothetical protein
LIELSRKKKEKSVFGVLGDKRRSNSRAKRLIVNSLGEGAMWVLTLMVIWRVVIIYNHHII